VLVTPEIDRRNRRHALLAAFLLAVLIGVCGCFFAPFLTALVLVPLGYWLIRRRCLRRLKVAERPFPAAWNDLLERRVRYFKRLDDSRKKRFQQMINVFLDEVRITGVRTEVDDTVRLLVAASAIIPIFGFKDWEYHRLGEVLIYPGSFDQDYHSEKAMDANILGLTGLGHLRGVVILSKPSLLAGFSASPNEDNVGVHEFAHLVEQEEVESGLPPEVPLEIVKKWVEYVGRELMHPSNGLSRVNDYAYTNEHEFFAVLSEYFFGSPEKLKAENPAIYNLLRGLFHQDPGILTSRYSPSSLPGRPE